eukprot:c4472_g1_i1 orf=3-179(-)
MTMTHSNITAIRRTTMPSAQAMHEFAQLINIILCIQMSCVQVDETSHMLLINRGIKWLT